MSARDMVVALYQGLADNAGWVLLTCLALPVTGTLFGWIGKARGGREDGRAVASAIVGIAIVLVLLEVMAIALARLAFRADILDADIALLAGPVLCLAGCLLGVRLVFPLSELGSVRTVVDIGLFAAACAATVWVFTKFRGWGVVFFGDIGQMMALGALGWLLLRRLYRRAFGGAPRRWGENP